MLYEDTLRELVAEGLSTRGIASRVGVSQLQVRFYLRRFGLKTSQTRERPSTEARDRAIQAVVPGCRSVSDVCRALGLSHTGSSFKAIQERIRALGLATDHFMSAGRIAAQNREQRTTDDLFHIYPPGAHVYWAGIKKQFLRRVPYACVECGQGSVWANKPLVLHMDHINGDKCDNRLENLRLLCPNCHTQTRTFGSRNAKRSAGKVAVPAHAEPPL